VEMSKSRGCGINNNGYYAQTKNPLGALCRDKVEQPPFVSQFILKMVTKPF